MPYSLKSHAIDQVPEVIAWVSSPAELLRWVGPSLTWPLTCDAFVKQLSDKNKLAFSFHEQTSNKLLGYFELHRREHHADIYLARFIVNPEERNKGIAKAMLREALTISREQYYAQTVDLVVFKQNIEAIKCYQSLGFEIVARKIKPHECDGCLHERIAMEVDLSEPCTNRLICNTQDSHLIES